VANYISGTISVVDLPSLRVINTLVTSNQPSDIVFAGNPPNGFVSCGAPNLVEVFAPQLLLWKTNLVIDGNRPRAMAVSPDGNTVYVAVFESGNANHPQLRRRTAGQSAETQRGQLSHSAIGRT
jgi:DNA-binding beta-propeller fold protein YncE